LLFSRTDNRLAKIALRHVRKVFPNGQEAVAGISFTVEDGEFAVLVGPSGCGKTTTLRMIAGLEEITSGEVFIGDQVVNDAPPRDRDVALVFQNYALYPHMSAFENMALGLRLRKYPKREIHTRVMQAAEILSVTNVMHRKPKQLSGGQRQRIAVGRAIVRKPKVFLFDEPLSNLDAQLRTQMRVEITNLHRQLDATMVYVTHDQTEAMTMGTRIIVMKEGSVQQIDTPRMLYRRPANLFVAGFIGRPTMNFFSGRIRAAPEESYIFCSASGNIHLPLPANRDLSEFLECSVVAGVRSEDLFLATESTSCIEATPLLWEDSGAETLLHARSGEDAFVVRMQKGVTRAALCFTVDPNRVHLFDAETEKALPFGK